jgi:hypothetical protein
MRRVVDSRILLKVVSRRKPTVSSGRKAAVLGATWRVTRTPPEVWEQGMHRVTGARGRTTCLLATFPDRGTGRPKALAWPGGVHEVASPCGTPRTPRKPARDWEASDERSNPRRAGRESERSIVPVKVGNRGPRDPREGRRRWASRSAGEKDGRYLEITNRHTTTPAPGGAGRPRGRSCVDNAGPPDRRRLASGGLPPHEQVERSGHRWGDGEAVVSPILANLCLHDVLDVWFAEVVQRHCDGQALLWREADAFVCAFQDKRDAARFSRVLGKRGET